MSKDIKTGVADYVVGYGKPPTRTKFRKGQSGNPRGRPRKEASKGFMEIMGEELERVITVRSGDEIVRMKARELIIRNLYLKAARGNTKAQANLAELLTALPPPSQPPPSQPPPSSCEVEPFTYADLVEEDRAEAMAWRKLRSAALPPQGPPLSSSTDD